MVSFCQFVPGELYAHQRLNAIVLSPNSFLLCVHSRSILLGLLRCGPRDGSGLFALSLLIRDVAEVHSSQGTEDEDVADDEADNALGQVEDVLEQADDRVDGALEDLEGRGEDALDDLHDRGKQVADALGKVRHGVCLCGLRFCVWVVMG